MLYSSQKQVIPETFFPSTEHGTQETKSNTTKADMHHKPKKIYK